MRISRIQIQNFRNFHDLDIALAEHAVIVGENKIGKSNLLFALRLLLDPSLPDSARQLKEEDFWDGLQRPLTKKDIIEISIEFSDFENNDRYLAVLGEFPISTQPMVSRLTYVFGPINAEKDEEIKESDYEFFIYGGDNEKTRIGGEFRRRLPLDLLPALRDVRTRPHPANSYFGWNVPGAVWSECRRYFPRAEFLSLSPTSVAQAAHHQHHRTLLCRSQAANPTHGLLRQRGERGPDYLLYLPALQPRLEKPHPQAFYTSGLTSPLPSLRLTVLLPACTFKVHEPPRTERDVLRLSHSGQFWRGLRFMI